MTYIELPAHETERELSYYLAAEEYVARTYGGEEDLFFIWQVDPTVIFGRNQLIENEVNLSYCREMGIRTFRRKSGGGCVFADRGNLMFSYITPERGSHFVFDRYMRLLAFMLQKLGVAAETTGRNDVMVKGRKVSGAAFYRAGGQSILHNTLLYDVDIEMLVRSITPSNEKLVSKGVDSVRQRVMNLKECLDVGLEELKVHVRGQLCGERTLRLTEADEVGIRAIERTIRTEEFIYGNNPRCTVHRQKRIEGVGELDARIEVQHSRIRRVNLMGDYFLVGDLDGDLLGRLQGLRWTREAVTEALQGVDVGEVILNLTTEQFVDLLFD